MIPESLQAVCAYLQQQALKLDVAESVSVDPTLGISSGKWKITLTMDLVHAMSFTDLSRLLLLVRDALGDQREFTIEHGNYCVVIGNMSVEK